MYIVIYERIACKENLRIMRISCAAKGYMCFIQMQSCLLHFESYIMAQNISSGT